MIDKTSEAGTTKSTVTDKKTTESKAVDKEDTEKATTDKKSTKNQTTDDETTSKKATATDEDETTSKKEMGATLGAYLGIQGLIAFFGLFYFWDTVLYMLPRTCKRRFDEKGNSSSSGVKYDF